MVQFNCVIPLRIEVAGASDGVDFNEVADCLAKTVKSRLQAADGEFRRHMDTVPPGTVQSPQITLPQSLPDGDLATWRNVIADGIARGTRDSLIAIAPVAATSARTQPPAGQSKKPSGRAKVLAKPNVTSLQFEELVLISDRVIEKPPPFEDALVMQLRANHYVSVKSRHYALTDNIARAEVWGKALFGTVAWVIAAKAEKTGVMFYVAALNEALTVAAAEAQVVETGVPGALGRFPGRVLATLGSGFHVAAVFFVGGDRAAPSDEAFTGYTKLVQQAREEGSAEVEAGAVRQAIFDPIDKLLDAGDDDSLQQAAELLAELNALAFSAINTDKRLRYLKALIKAWTWEAQETAIIEILKSVESLTELKSLFQQLKDAQLWDQLFSDMDSQLWSLLTAIGEKFGDPSPITFTLFLKLLLEAKLISVAPGIVLNKDGEPEISLDVMAEIEEAARSFVRFLEGTLESIWTLISHPDKIIEGIGQLVKMVVMVELAQSGYPPAQMYVLQVLGAVGKQLLAGLKGAAITEIGPAIERRIRYAIIWEVASFFIGVGEVKAVLEAAGLTEKLAALAALLRLLGILEESAEGEKVVSKLEKLAEIMSRSSKLLTRDEEVLRLLSHLPEEDVKLLSRALQKAELGEGLDLVKLAEANKELAEIATESLRKAEALSSLAAKSGGLSDEVIGAFQRLAGHYSGEEMSELVRHVPPGEGSRFARAVKTIPGASLADGGAASTEFLEALAGSTKRMDALSNYGYRTFAGLFERADGEVAALDQYLAALTDIESKLPNQSRAVELRRFLDKLEAGETKEWLELEQARIARFEPTVKPPDPVSLDKLIEEELAKFGPDTETGTKPLMEATTPQAPAGPPPVTSFRDALASVDTTNIPASRLANLKAGWKKYVAEGKKALRSEDEYIRFIWGHESKQWPKITQSPRNLGAIGAVEQEAGHTLQKVLDARLPAGSSNARDIPTRFGNVRPDHLPPGKATIYFNPDGTVSATKSGTPFSARFVADSKYRDVIPVSDQTRGFVRLAALSDEKKLVFYVRWQAEFPAASSLAADAMAVGYELPASTVPKIVGAGVRSAASEATVDIVLVSNPLWR